jgi:hypothetical protein
MTKALVKLKDTDTASIAVDLFRENLFSCIAGLSMRKMTL